MPLRASHSEVESFLKCERSHFYAYGESIEPTKMSDALARGQLVHISLAEYYRTLKDGGQHAAALGAAIKALSEYARTISVSNMEGLRTECTKLVVGHCNYWFKQGYQWEIVEVEKQIDVKVTDDFILPIVVDLIVIDREHGLTVVDHKVTYNFFTETGLDLNPQLAKYMKALQYEGYDVKSAMYNEIRYRTTKSNADDETERYRRTKVNMPLARINRTMVEQIRAAQRISRLKSLSKEEWESKVLRVASSIVCDRCSFKDICTSDLNGNPGRELMLKYDYKPRTRRDVNS